MLSRVCMSGYGVFGGFNWGFGGYCCTWRCAFPDNRGAYPAGRPEKIGCVQVASLVCMQRVQSARLRAPAVH